MPRIIEKSSGWLDVTIISMDVLCISTSMKWTRTSSLRWNHSSTSTRSCLDPSSRTSTTDIVSRSSLVWDRRCTVWLIRSRYYTTQQREILAMLWSIMREWAWKTSNCTSALLRQRRRKMQWSKAASNASTTRPSISAPRSRLKHSWLAQTTSVGSWTTTYIHWHSVITDWRVLGKGEGNIHYG